MKCQFKNIKTGKPLSDKCPICELYISKHTPKEMNIVFRKVNEVIRWLKK